VSFLAKIPDPEPPAGVTYIGPRALVLAFALACALLVGAFFGLDRLTDALESAEAASSEPAPPALPALVAPRTTVPAIRRTHAAPRSLVPAPPRSTPLPAVARSPIADVARSLSPAATRSPIAQPLRGRQFEAHVARVAAAPRIALAKHTDPHVRAQPQQRQKRAAAPARIIPQAPLLIPFRSASNALFVPLRAAQTPTPATPPVAP
jgi:hypothetical protein